jgi:hypothetical protein
MAIADLSLNTTHISDNLSNYEAARNSFFVFHIDPSELTNLYSPDFDPDGGAQASINEGTRFDGQTASDYLRLNVVKASVPSFTVATHEYRRGNDVIKFAGVPTYKDGSITVDDVVSLQVKDMLYSWLYLAYNPKTRKGGRMKDYKKTCTLIEYTQDYQQIRYWTLYGCFVTGIDEAEFDRTNDGKRQITVAISYDRAEMSLGDTIIATGANT